MPFSSPIWRSLNHLKGSLNHPKKVTKNCQDIRVYQKGARNCCSTGHGSEENLPELSMKIGRLVKALSQSESLIL